MKHCVFTRAAALFLALGLLAALAGCGEKEPTDYGIEVEGPKRTSAPAPEQPASSDLNGDEQPEEGVVWELEPRTDIEIIRSLADYDKSVSGTVTGQERLAFFSQDGGIGVIDFLGNIVVPASENVEWCPVCGIVSIEDHRMYDNYGNVRSDNGHGSSDVTCVYDQTAGQTYAQSYGDYVPWADQSWHPSGYAMVPEVRITRLGEEEFGFSFLYEGETAYPIDIEELHSYLLLNLDTGLPVNSQRYTGYEQRSGLFTVQQNGLWGCVDGEGHELLSCTYIDLRPFVDGVAAVHTGSGWGFVDMEGRAFTEQDFLGAASAWEGRAWVKTEEGWGVIDLARNPAK